jgi:hypothetical protein
MYSYDRRTKTAASMDLHSEWREVIDKHEKAEQHDLKALLDKLVNYLKSVGYDLNVRESYLGKRWHGSDGWRMEGQLVIKERAENTVKAPNAASVKKWVEMATGTYGTPAKGKEPDTWIVNISED